MTGELGVLYQNPKKRLGTKGGFKTAHSGRLFLQTPVSDGLGSPGFDQVAVKRAYDTLDPSQNKIQRLSQPQEFQAIKREAESLHWAQALWKMTMDCIDAKWPTGEFTVSETIEEGG